jgi:CheY-like chemotaxis protein
MNKNNDNLNNVMWMAQVSHELKTPLNSIIGIISLLDETFLNDEQREYTDIIKKSSNDLLILVSHILDYAKLQSNKLSLKVNKIRFRKIIDDICNNFSYKIKQKNLEFIIEYDEKIPTYVHCDSIRIKQILNNLISNSIKFTNFGFIKINIILLELTNNNIKIDINVSDSGIGIPKKKLKYLFKPFHQCHRNGSHIGTGLGLSICKKICKLMNGELKVISNQNGTSIHCNIYLDIDKNHHIEKKLDILQGKKILIIDSDPSKRLNIASMLFEYKIKVLALNNPNDIYEYLKRNYTFDLVIINENIFDENIKKIFKNMKYLLISDYKNNIINDQDIQYIYRPIEEKKLIDILLSIFGKIICEKSYNNYILNESKFILKNLNINKNILIVDDVIDNQIVLFKLLKKFGYINIKTCNNGKECLDMITKENFDIIFLDIIMPIMDGKETMKKINEIFDKKNKPKICVMTANIMNEMYEIYDYDYYIEKPIKIKYLKDILNKLG